MQLLKLLFLLPLFLFLSLTASAQLSVQVAGGLVSGSPMGPIPEGATGQPGVRFWGEFGAEYRFAERLGLRLGLQLATKAGRYNTPVSGEQQAEANIFGAEVRLPFRFDYEGNVEGLFANRYWQIPLTVAWYNDSRLIPFAGLYWARNARPYHRGFINIEVSNGLVEIRNQSFDESAGLRAWDWGLVAGTDFRILDGLGFSLAAQYGLISILETNPDGFEGAFRNLYLTGGVYIRINR
ncbi:MAG: outer membrane beta-barrel protein [Bacteroidota bacterium]